MENKKQAIFEGINDIQDVARLLNSTHAQIRYLFYGLSDASRYTTFRISKRKGGYREINAPKKQIKEIQATLAGYLHSELQKRNLIKNCAHGFIHGRSIKTNAEGHVRKRNILNIDLKDFFPSINFGRVYRLFLSRAFAASPKASAVLAKICCHNNHLPQGAPTSPIISNMICFS